MMPFYVRMSLNAPLATDGQPSLSVRFHPLAGHCLYCNQPCPADELQSAYLGADNVWLGGRCKKCLTSLGASCK